MSTRNPKNRKLRRPRKLPGQHLKLQTKHSGTQTHLRAGPDELDVPLQYRFASSLNNGSGGLAAKSFYTNAAYDVDPSVGSTETTGFDEYASLYSYYRVIGYRYELTVVNQSATPILAYALNTNEDATLSGTNFALYSTNAHCSSKLITAVSPTVHTFRGRKTIAQIVGSPAVEFTDSFRSVVTSIPSDRTWFTVGVESIGGATVQSTFDFKLTMVVRFYARQVDLTLTGKILRMEKYLQSKEDYKLKKKLERRDSKNTLGSSSLKN